MNDIDLSDGLDACMQIKNRNEATRFYSPGFPHDIINIRMML